jgi:predicted small secreted protein
MTRKRSALSATAAALLLLPVLLAGCDATAGAGRDITRAGQAITQSATQNKDY